MKHLRHYSTQIGVLVLTIALLIVFFPAFANGAAVFGSLSAFASLGLVALGVSVTMIAGELDMSAASVAATAGIVAVIVDRAVGGVAGLTLGILSAVVCGVAFGAAQGYAIYRLRINSIVFTVGTLILVSGLGYVLSGNAPISLTDYLGSDILGARIGFVTPLIVIVLVIFIAIGWYLARARPGRETYAIGGARNEAIAAGVSLRRVLIQSFAISGGCAALTGALLCLLNASASPLAFSDLLVQAVSAALIGGVSIYGGRGTAWNVALGVAIVAVLTDGLAVGGIPPYVTTLIVGILLFVLIGIEAVQRLVTRRRALGRMRTETIALATDAS